MLNKQNKTLPNYLLLRNSQSWQRANDRKTAIKSQIICFFTYLNRQLLNVNFLSNINYNTAAGFSLSHRGLRFNPRYDAFSPLKVSNRVQAVDELVISSCGRFPENSRSEIGFSRNCHDELASKTSWNLEGHRPWTLQGYLVSFRCTAVVPLNYKHIC